MTNFLELSKRIKIRNIEIGTIIFKSNDFVDYPKKIIGVISILLIPIIFDTPDF